VHERQGEGFVILMESFGAYLKNLREERGISLEEVSERTKIAASNLNFLENDHYELLPPKVFVKGFIRSYVEELGLDPEEALKRFDEFVKEGELSGYEEEEHPLFQAQPPASSFVKSTWFTVALTAAGILALGILLVTGVSHLFLSEQSANVRMPTVTTVGPSGQTARGMEAPDQTAFTEPPRTQAGKKVLEIKALSSAWIRVEPDSGKAEELVMAPGDVQIFTAKHGFYVQTGNAGGIRLRYDGRELPPLGKENQSLSLRLP
jgi:cytoskeleton protein RodZ